MALVAPAVIGGLKKSDSYGERKRRGCGAGAKLATGRGPVACTVAGLVQRVAQAHGGGAEACDQGRVGTRARQRHVAQACGGGELRERGASVGKEMGRHMRAERLGRVRRRTAEPTVELAGVARSRALELGLARSFDLREAGTTANLTRGLWR
jgi:hypothetical protein